MCIFLLFTVEGVNQSKTKFFGVSDKFDYRTLEIAYHPKLTYMLFFV